jgi:nitrate/TMAO reductase-like tetraheme cytochrome c subunit
MSQPQERKSPLPIHRDRLRPLVWAVIGLVLLAVAIALAFTAYANRHELFAGGQVEHHTFLEKLEKLEIADPGVSSAAFLEFTRRVPLQARTPEEDAPIFVHERTSAITSYPCSSCHVQPLEELRAQSAAAGQLAHWQIELKHAGPEVMTCTTCHNPDNLDELRTLAGAPIHFDASYQTCAQCHAPQYRDWLGGAHGKRIGGWAEPRVIYSCTDCHNPHDPAWDIRWPAAPPQQVGR